MLDSKEGAMLQFMQATPKILAATKKENGCLAIFKECREGFKGRNRIRRVVNKDVLYKSVQSMLGAAVKEARRVF